MTNELTMHNLIKFVRTTYKSYPVSTDIEGKEDMFTLDTTSNKRH